MVVTEDATTLMDTDISPIRNDTIKRVKKSPETVTPHDVLQETTGTHALDNERLRSRTRLGYAGGYVRWMIKGGLHNGVMSEPNMAACSGCGEGVKVYCPPHWLCLTLEQQRKLRNRALVLPNFRDLVYDPWEDMIGEGILSIDVEPPSTSILMSRVHWQQDLRDSRPTSDGYMAMNIIEPEALKQNIHLAFKWRKYNHIDALLTVCDTFGPGFDLTVRSSTCLDTGEFHNKAEAEFHRRDYRYNLGVDSSSTGPVYEAAITHVTKTQTVWGACMTYRTHPDQLVVNVANRLLLTEGLHLISHFRTNMEWGTATPKGELRVIPRLSMGGEWISRVHEETGSFTKAHVGATVESQEGVITSLNLIHFVRQGLGLRASFISDIANTSLHMTFGLAYRESVVSNALFFGHVTGALYIHGKSPLNAQAQASGS
eukprot:CFRG2288T1